MGVAVDIGKGGSCKSVTFVAGSPADVGAASEGILTQLFKRSLPGSSRTARLRKKRRKAVLAIISAVVSPVRRFASFRVAGELTGHGSNIERNS